MRSVGGKGGVLSFFFFPYSTHHERDWPPCKVVCFGLATNALKVRNNNNNYDIPVLLGEVFTDVCDGVGDHILAPKARGIYFPAFITTNVWTCARPFSVAAIRSSSLSVWRPLNVL